MTPITAAPQSAATYIYDAATYALNVVDYAHHEIHSGSYYHAGTAVNVANAGTVLFSITTPNTTKYAHLVGAVVVEGEAYVKFYEGSTLGTAGTALLAVNRNRNSTNTATTSVSYVPAPQGTAGSVIFESQVGSGRAVGGGVRQTDEWILAANTVYVLEVVNSTANDNYINVSLDWYEHINRE